MSTFTESKNGSACFYLNTAGHKRVRITSSSYSPDQKKQLNSCSFQIIQDSTTAVEVSGIIFNLIGKSYPRIEDCSAAFILEAVDHFVQGFVFDSDFIELQKTIFNSSPSDRHVQIRQQVLIAGCELRRTITRVFGERDVNSLAFIYSATILCMVKLVPAKWNLLSNEIAPLEMAGSFGLTRQQLQLINSIGVVIDPRSDRELYIKVASQLIDHDCLAPGLEGTRLPLDVEEPSHSIVSRIIDSFCTTRKQTTAPVLFSTRSFEPLQGRETVTPSMLMGRLKLEEDVENRQLDAAESHQLGTVGESVEISSFCTNLVFRQKTSRGIAGFGAEVSFTRDSCSADVEIQQTIDHSGFETSTSAEMFAKGKELSQYDFNATISESRFTTFGSSFSSSSEYSPDTLSGETASVSTASPGDEYAHGLIDCLSPTEEREQERL